jgi:hypothetical protein
MVCSGRVELPRPHGHRVLSTACLPFPSRAHEWTRPDSNRAPPLCKSGALPDELRAHESQRGGSNALPPGYESGAPPVVLRWHGAGGESRTRGCRLTRPVRHRWLAGMVSEAGFEPARPEGHQHLKLARLPFRHKDMSLLPRLDSNQAFGVQSAASSQIDDEGKAAGGRESCRRPHPSAPCERRPGRGGRLEPQPHPSLGRGAVALALIAAATGLDDQDVHRIPPPTSAVPRRRATDCATSPYVGNARVERAASWSQTRPGHRAGRSRSPGTPPICGGGRASYAIHCGIFNHQCHSARKCAGQSRGDRTRTCNLRFWRPPRYQLRHAPMRLLCYNEKPPDPWSGWAA